MPVPDPAARRYAEAAYLIAREDGSEDAWLTGLRGLAALFDDPGARVLFANSRVPAEQKRQLVERAVTGVDPKVMNLALLLLRRNRTELAPGIAQAYQEILDREKGIHHALVTSAVPLAPDELEDVQRKLIEITGGSVVVRTEVDEDIIGGIVVRIGDRMIDGSVRSKLIALRQKLAGAT